eukprot:gene32127-38861_t
MEADLENWHIKQGAILTGEGALLKESEVFSDYLPYDLAHYHLINGTSHTTFRAWIKANRRSFSIVGCWSRPLFAGGFLESTSEDTEAFNLQTPSVFIDMRIPTKRPTPLLARLKGLEDCDKYQLRILARQHCFAGYTLPELSRAHRGQPHGELFTRHHVVDWNFHPRFPRPRPNRWWVLCNGEGEARCSSFKEFGWVRDRWQLPLYMERWERRRAVEGACASSGRYLACRRRQQSSVGSSSSSSGSSASSGSNASSGGSRGAREAWLLVVDGYFCFVRDRDYALLDDADIASRGGGAFLVDALLRAGRLAAARAYLDLEGSFGALRGADFGIQHSTHPWLEGTALFPARSGVSLVFHQEIGGGGDRLAEWVWTGEGRGAGCYEVLECSFSPAELRALFPSATVLTAPSNANSSSGGGGCPWRSKL